MHTVYTLYHTGWMNILQSSSSAFPHILYVVKTFDSLDHVHDLLAVVKPDVMVGNGHPLEGHLEHTIWKI